MPIVIPPGYAQVTMTYTGAMFPATGGGTTTFGWGNNLTDTDLSLLATAVALSWQTNLQDLTSDKVTLAEVRAVSEDAFGGAAVSFTGSVGDDTSPPNVAILVSHYSARRGPRGRGRSYLPGLAFDSSTNDDGTLPAGQRNALQVAVEDFFGTISGDPTLPDDTEQYILHNDEGSSTAGAPNLVLNRLVSGSVATQRRRLRR